DLFNVSWSGADGLGSGIKSFTIYVSDNNGAYAPWQTDTNATSATYTGIVGHTYRFYSVATDNLNHVENAPNTPDATTTIQVVGTASKLIFGTPPIVYI